MAYYCVPEKAKAALLTVSAQQDFLRSDSPIKASGANRAKPALHRLVDGCRRHDVPIFHAVRLYRPDGSNVDACRRQAVEEGLRVLMPGSLGAELLDELKPDPAIRLNPCSLLKGRFQELGPRERAFYRPRWGAFHDTDLELRLRDLGVTTLILCGLSFATGVRATVFEASARDFRVVVVPDALANANDDGVRELGRLGIYLMTSVNCLAWLAGRGGATAVA
ncbi:MAG: cysteine hydrolase family protein [Alphaproteobacteria bacterium]